MKFRFIPVVAVTTLLFSSAQLSLAADSAATGDTSGKTSAKSTPASKAAIEARRKAAGKIRTVDINSAKKEELMKLPGVGEAEADKIIAGRPYGSKAWLVSNNVIPEGLYVTIKAQIVAKQPFKDGKQNAAVYSKKQ